jgi:H+/Cl- antiporter ClcA
MIGFLVVWIAFGLVVLGLAVYRKSVASTEQDWVHLAAGEEHMVGEQVQLGQRLKKIDRWGIWLTLVLALYGLVMGSIFILRTWEAGKTLGM